MTIPSINCEQFSEQLADYLESDASEATRGAIEAHAASCGECGALLADLRELRVNASALPPRVPQRDLWAGIAARIETPVVEISPSGRLDPVNVERDRRSQRIQQRIWTGLAAAGLVAVTATITHQVTKRSVAPPTTVAVKPQPTDTPATAATTSPVPNAADSAPSTAANPATATSLASNKLSPEKTYDAEIARLRAVVAQRRATLDTGTINVIERNLKIIDDAIAQCRQALVKDPASRYLMQSLNDALDTKIQLLRTAASLPSRA
jgi:hypothetical protein